MKRTSLPLLRRREFVTLLGGAAAWPLAARAQQTDKVIRIGFFGPALTSPPPIALYQTFIAELRELGFNEGQNAKLQYRAVDDPRGAFVSASELMRWQPELIVAVGPELTLQAVVGASGFIPVVMVAVNFDPISRGYVQSLARPGGNITGVVFQQLELAQKQVDLLAQAFPGKTRLAVLFDAQSADQFVAAEGIAKSLNLKVQPIKLENPPYDFDAAFRRAVADAAEMMLVLSTPFFTPQVPRVVELANAYRLPCMYIFKLWADAGGLISYGADFPRMYRQPLTTSLGLSKAPSPPICRSSRPRSLS
jgi:putative ABC transport system substrate-binding protein